MNIVDPSLYNISTCRSWVVSFMYR